MLVAWAPCAGAAGAGSVAGAADRVATGREMEPVTSLSTATAVLPGIGEAADGPPSVGAISDCRPGAGAAGIFGLGTARSGVPSVAPPGVSGVMVRSSPCGDDWVSWGRDPSPDSSEEPNRPTTRWSELSTIRTTLTATSSERTRVPHPPAAFPWEALLGVGDGADLSLRAPLSLLAACAARRAAAMKLDLPPGSGTAGGLAGPSAASEAAMRSTAELPVRARMAPG